MQTMRAVVPRLTVTAELNRRDLHRLLGSRVYTTGEEETIIRKTCGKEKYV
jgi:hypothetical protein